MRRFTVSVAVAVSLIAAPVLAQHGNSGNHGPSTHAAPTHPNGPNGPKNGGNGSPKHSGGTAPSTVTTSTTPINFSGTRVGQKLTTNTALQSKLAARLTALGYGGTVFEAAYGFKNLGQFVAAT